MTTDFATSYPFTFDFAVSVLEKEFDATYRGTKTVDEMCSSLTDYMWWENEPLDKVYHQFETQSGPNQIVADDDFLKLANHYAK